MSDVPTHRVPEDVLAAHLDGEAVLLHMDTKNYYRLNATAAHVFRGLERGLGRDALLDGLCAEFEVERGVAAAELDRLLGDLSQRGLLAAA
ncbi:MAG TPA: PqqD family protein, partial [Longimicrobium sp.]|nr:PqqD family protein [Longimicrobium sp.]